MKIKLLAILSLVFALLATSSCNTFELNEHMEEAAWLVCGGEWNKKDNTTRRAFLVLMVTGLNQDAYTVEYTIDGKPGTGQNALTSIDQETATKVYNWQKFEGSDYMSEEKFSGQYDGNFPSGSSTKLRFIDRKDKTHPNSGSASFLSPKLDPGKHVLQFKVTNSYGESYSGSKEITIQNKKE